MNLTEMITRSTFPRGILTKSAIIGGMILDSCSPGKLTMVRYSDAVNEKVDVSLGEYRVLKCLPDDDLDGYGRKGLARDVEGYNAVCPERYALVDEDHPLDCNDANKEIHPGALDICNLIDDNCNGFTDEYVGECTTKCGKGNLYCQDGKTVCDASKPKQEICDGWDNDCNGKIDELAQCCVPDSVENTYCFDTKKIEQKKVCKSDYTWGDWQKVSTCWTPLYKWSCEKKVIGVVDVNAPQYNFTPKQPADADVGSESNQNGLPQWCCVDGKGHEWGVESHPLNQNFLKKTCNCISNVQGVDDNTNNNPTKNKKGSKEGGENKRFWQESFQCPPHEYSAVKTKIEIVVQNEEVDAQHVWLNWYTYGHPPSERVRLLQNEEYRFVIDERMIPRIGGEMEICSSTQGCSERLALQIGERRKIYGILYEGTMHTFDEEGRKYHFEQEFGVEKCDEDTLVKMIFRNHKTLDLQPWINWQRGFPVEDKVVIEPQGEYTFLITQDELMRGRNEMALCTSSYGCFPRQMVSCGDHKTYTVDWVFGRIPLDRK